MRFSRRITMASFKDRKLACFIPSSQDYAELHNFLHVSVRRDAKTDWETRYWID